MKESDKMEIDIEDLKFEQRKDVKRDYPWINIEIEMQMPDTGGVLKHWVINLHHLF